MNSSDFYQSITPFGDFNDLMADEHYQDAPSEHVVIVADIKGSTKAIEEGRYKDVNTLGVSCIVAAQNVMERQDFPYVFGGDGASLVIPPDCVEKVSTALQGVASLAESMFDLSLRVGIVPVQTLYDQGTKLEVARFTLVSNKAMALFRGGGMELADSLIKNESEKYIIESDSKCESDLSGLSCRWQPIPSLNGKILTLLIKSLNEPSKTTYLEVLMKMNSILKGDVTTANPVHIENMNYRTMWKNISDEWRYQKNPFSMSLIKRVIEIVAATLVFKWKIPPLLFNPRKYAESMASHSDFRKFDDMLRLVVDVSPDQTERISEFLTTMRERGNLAFGLHSSDSALMTCFVYGLEEGNHIHFIDGGDGGYAMAARQLKDQLVSS